MEAELICKSTKFFKRPASKKGGFFICPKQSIMYYNENTIVYFDGEYLKAADAKGNLFDQSLHYGYAAFEGIRAYPTANGSRIFKAKQHFERLQHSCEAVAIPYPYSNEELIAISYEILKRNKIVDGYIRPLVSCTPNMSLTKPKASQIFIAAWEWPPLLGNKLLRLKTSSYRRINPASFKVTAKVSGHYVNSILASQEARDLGYDEALLLDADGYVAEGPGSNIFIQLDGILHTPQLGSILPGITRATVLEICKRAGIQVVERKIKPEEVRGAESAFYCGTAAEVIGLESLDDVPFQLEWQDSLGAVIQKVYKNLVLEKKYTPEEELA
jgi:branched-chain amino acid aminotransferase